MALETKMDTVLENQKLQASEFRDMNGKLDQLLPTYATKAEFESFKKRHTLQTWLVGTLSAAFGFILTVLIQNYFSK